MYQVINQAVAEALESESRCFRAILDFGNGVEIRDDAVGKVKPSFGSVQNGTPCIGNVVSTQCEIEILRIPDEIDKLEGKEFQLYFYLVDILPELSENTLETFKDFTLEELSEYTLGELAVLLFPKIPYEPIPIGKFTVLKCKKLSDYYVLTCSDRIHFADSMYKSSLTYPTTSDKVMREIAGQIGCVAEEEPPQCFLTSSNGYRLVSSNGYRLITSSWQFSIAERPTNYTKRQMIGFIAAMRGKFAVIDRTGTLVQRWYGEGQDVVLSDESECYIDDFEMSETSIYINNLSCKINDNLTVEVGAPGRKMSFESPYMTGNRLSALYEELCIPAEDYYPCDFTQRLGDPRFDLWDRIWLYEKLILLLNMNYTFDGGLMLTVTSGGDTDTEEIANGTY